MSEPVNNPAAAFATADVVPKVDRIKCFLEDLEGIKFCVGRNGHEECRPLEALEEALNLMLSYKLECCDAVPKSKEHLNLAQTVYRCLMVNECVLGETTPDGRVLGSETEVAAYFQERVAALGISTGTRQVKLAPRVYYYDRHTLKYWAQSKASGGNRAVWQCLTAEAVRASLMAEGKSGLAEGPGLLSEADREMVNIRDFNGVDLAMPLAGYPEGLHTVKGLRILVTKSYRLPTPRQGLLKDWAHIYAIIKGMFGWSKQDKSPRAGYFLAHKLHCDINALRAGICTGGLAVLIAGLPDIGKTVLLSILRRLYGGRTANAGAALTEKTTFTEDLGEAELHIVDDGNPFSDRTARRRFSNVVKASVAAGENWHHGKGKKALTLPLYRRLYIVTNLDSLDAMPELEQSLMDKVMVLLARPFTMPEGLTPLPSMGDTVAWKAFNAILDREVDFFLGWLDTAKWPDGLAQRRFGTEAYKDPELLAKINELSANDELHYLVQKVLFCRRLTFERDGDPVDLVPERLRRVQDGVVEVEVNDLKGLLLKKGTIEQARHLFTTTRSLGCALRELRAARPSQYTRREGHGKIYWQVAQDAVDMGAGNEEKGFAKSTLDHQHTHPELPGERV